MNLGSKRCQIPPVGRRSTLENVGSSRHAMWVARSPAEFVTNGRSPPIGSRQSSQRSVCCWDMRGPAVGMGQSSQEPRRVRHVVSLLGAAAFLGITKPPGVLHFCLFRASNARPLFSMLQFGCQASMAGLSVGDSIRISSRSRERRCWNRLGSKSFGSSHCLCHLEQLGDAVQVSAGSACL
jgi:hypothetical protein